VSSRLTTYSGHYRPSAAVFSSFIHALQHKGVDLSHMSLSKSYAVLVGMEGYAKAKRTAKSLQEKIHTGTAKFVGVKKDPR
jgi:hypothetical protein